MKYIFITFCNCTWQLKTHVLPEMCERDLRLMKERHFANRLFTDGYLMEIQHVRVAKFEVYKVLH